MSTRQTHIAAGTAQGGPVSAVAGATLGNFIGLDRIHDQQLALAEHSPDISQQQLAAVTRATAQAETLLMARRLDFGMPSRLIYQGYQLPPRCRSRAPAQR
ncbi:hypothetical protein [Litorivicinus lipolyticus]|jgi:hypothetical protein|uniref:hypothetical protein n=1 Tax=Litorivicinus lipolyticus TaxID=418701 RepID=UPI003B5911E3